ncbi:methyltransferase domain-containing protein [Dactylosporangium sp. NPDC049140]|uniref:methyltransferase domain-containing protein n=1 Tax=Dactylosporangium sp. NPDC049140 TaxID=3155647 RepID=UPI0033CF2329
MSTTSNTVDALIRLLDAADALPGAAALRERSYDLLALPPGGTVADVGCGTGRAVAELADRGFQAIGVDRSEQMIEQARRRRPGLDLRSGDARRLPIPDASVAGYRADKVFHELTDAGQALAEARRVLTPGGSIVLIGQDWDTFVIDADDRALTRTIVHARADAIPSPWAARRYRNLLLAAGFDQPAVEVHTAVFTDAAMLPILVGLGRAAQSTGAISGEQADAWTAEQQHRAQTGRMFLAIPMFVASARRS